MAALIESTIILRGNIADIKKMLSAAKQIQKLFDCELFISTPNYTNISQMQDDDILRHVQKGKLVMFCSGPYDQKYTDLLGQNADTPSNELLLFLERLTNAAGQNKYSINIDNECTVDSVHTVTTFAYNSKELRMRQQACGEEDGEIWTEYIYSKKLR